MPGDRSRTTAPQITDQVLHSFDGCPDERLRELLQALVGHLHAFSAEVGLTGPELQRGIAELTRTGEITDAHRQEFVLWSDTLGLSMLVDALADGPDAAAPTVAWAATESTVLGPFYVAGSPQRGYGESIASEDGAGEPVWVYGHLRGTDGEAIADGELDVWQNGADRLYAVQRPEAPEDHLRGRFRTREDGSFGFVAVRPLPYPIPDDGPVGLMLAASGRHPWRPAHIHMIVRADGYRTLTTHIFDADSAYLDSDAVFAVKPSLMRRFEASVPTSTGGPRLSVECDLVLAAQV